MPERYDRKAAENRDGDANDPPQLSASEVARYDDSEGDGDPELKLCVGLKRYKRQ